MSRVLAIGDIHTPVEHPAYMSFCKDLVEQWDIDTVHFIGDIVDWHGVTFHARHPEAPGPADEYLQALQGVRRWRNAFPEATVSIGNHDERCIRLASSVNIPTRLLRDYADIWDTPDWTWENFTIIDNVYYTHGTGMSGVHAAYNASKAECMSYVMGHCHSNGGIKWTVTPSTRFFGMDTGCGIDDKAAAMAYGKHFKRRPCLSAGVVIDGNPYHEIMPASPGEKYHRSRFNPS